MRVRALGGLGELLRVADEHEVAGRPGDGQDVGERELSGLVDDEVVEAAGEVGPGEEPRRSGDDVDRALVEGVDERGVVGDPLHVVVLEDLVGLGLLRHPDPAPLLGGLGHDRLDEVADGGVAVGRDADLATGAHQLDDEPRGRVGLAGPGRPLHGEAAPVEVGGDADHRSGRGLVGLDELRGGGPAREPRWPLEQQVAGGLVRARRVEAPVGDVLREAQQGGALLAVVDGAVGDQCQGVLRLGGDAPLEVDDAMGGVVAHDAARGHVGGAVAVGGAAGEGVDRGLADGELGLLAGVEGVAVDLGALDLVDHTHVGEAGHGLGVGGEVVEVGLEAVEEAPPLGLVLAAVPVEQVREQPAGAPLGRRAGGGHVEALGQQLGGDLGGGDLGRDRLVGRCRLARLGPWQRAVCRLPLGAAGLEPVAQQQRGLAVDAVVRLDVVEDVLLARLDPLLVLHDARPRVDDLAVAGRQVEHLELLDRQRRQADGEALAHHAVEVDEDPAAQQVVELVDPGGVATRQLLEGGGLVGGVVVDVQVGVLRVARHDEVDERLEQLLLDGRVVGPPAPEGAEAALGPGHDDAEEVLEPEVAHVRVALDVEEDVAGAGRWQHLQAAVGRGVEQLVGRQLVGPGAGGDLEARLAHRLGQRGGGQAPHRGGGGVDRGQLGDGGDAGSVELAGLVAPEPRHAGHAVVELALRRAPLLPGAHGAVRHQLGVGVRRRPGEHELLEALLGGAVVGGDARSGHGDLAAIAEHHVHALGADPVDALDLLRVAAQLEHRVDLRPARQLGVLGLVDVAALGVGLRLAHHEVGVAPPPERGVGLVEEGGLVEDVVAAGHGLGGGGRGGAEALDRGGGGVEVDHLEAVGGEGVAVGVLVLDA